MSYSARLRISATTMRDTKIENLKDTIKSKDASMKHLLNLQQNKYSINPTS